MRRTIKFNGGQNISAPEEELAENEVALSLNLSLNQKPGYLVKRPDKEHLVYRNEEGRIWGNSDGSSKVLGYFKFCKRNGDKYHLTFYDYGFYGVEGIVNGLKWIKFPADGSVSSFGAIAPFFSTLGQKITGLAFGDRMLFTNGIDLMMFFEDENNYGKMEIVSPYTVPSGSVTEWGVGGMDLDPTLLQYKVSYYFDDDETKLSNTTPLSELIDGQYMFEEGIYSIKITLPVAKNTRVSGRIIYRRRKIPTNGGGFADDVFTEWFKIAKVENNVDTEYLDLIKTTGEEVLPESGLPKNTDTVPIAKYMENINNRVFYGNVIEPAEEAGIGFAYSQIFTVTQSEGKTLTNVIVPITLQWNNPGADNYIKYGDFAEANEGKDIKFMLNDAGIVTPLGFEKIAFRGSDHPINPKEIDFKIRMPELKSATGQEIVIFYGKTGMASLSNWQDLYRKELLYSDMKHLFHMDRYKGSSELYDRATDKKGELKEIAKFDDGDGGFYGGDESQILDAGKHIQVAESSSDKGYIQFTDLNDTETLEDQSLSFWFKLGDTSPTGDDDIYHSLFNAIRYQGGANFADFKIFVQHRESGQFRLCLRLDSSGAGSVHLQSVTIDNPWDGKWHHLFLIWKTESSQVRWRIYLDGSSAMNYLHDDKHFFDSYTGSFWCFGQDYEPTDGNPNLWVTPRPYWIDTFVWYNRVLESAEIAKLYLRETYFKNPIGFVGGEPYSLAEKRCANRIYWSKEDVPENIASDALLDIGSVTEIAQLRKLKNNLCILKKNEIRLIYNTEMAVEYWQFSDNLTGDVLNLGLVAPNSLDSIEGAIIGLAPLGVFIYDGSSFAFPGKDKLDPYLRGLSQAILQEALGKYYPKRSEYWLWVNERLFILDVPSGRWTEYTGIKPTCFALWEDDNGELLWAGKTTFQIHKMLEDFDSDRENEIAVDCKSGQFHHQEGQERKHSDLLAMWLRFNGGDKVAVNVDIDGKSKNYEHIEDNIKRPLKLGSRGELIQFEITENSMKSLEIKDLEFKYNVRRRP